MATKRKSVKHAPLDIELYDLNAYKRCQAEYEGVQTFIEALDLLKENFNLSGIDHEPNFKYVDLETKQALHSKITELTKILDDCTNQLHSNAHKLIKSVNR